MLTQMRTLSQNWIGRSIMAVVLGFIIISFAVWGIGDRFTNYNASELAVVGSTKITVDQYRRAYQNELQQLQAKQRRAITNEEAKREGLDRRILERILKDAMLDQEVRQLGLAISDQSIAQAIMKDDAFKGPAGVFDRQQFMGLLRENNLSEAGYVRDQRGAILRHQIGNAIVGGVTLPQAMVGPVHRFKAEVRDVDFFVLPSSAAGTIAKPSDADLKSYYDQHARTFFAPEYRKLLVLSVVPANLVKPDAVPEADVKKRYDEMKAMRFSVPEKRKVERLFFADEKAAAAAKAKLDGGESFDKLAADEKKKPDEVSLGSVVKAQITDPAIADAAFSLADGKTSAPVKSKSGFALVHVAQIEPAHEQPLMEVSAQLKDELAIIHAKAEATKVRDQIEDQRTSGKTLTEAAASVGLKPKPIDAIDSQGRDKAGKPVEGLVEGPALLKAAFASDVGADTEMIQTPSGGEVWYEVAGIEPSHQRSLADVRPQLERAWRNAEITKRLAAEADKAVKAIDGGKTLEAVAAEAGKQQIYKATNIAREGAPGVAGTAAEAMFGKAVGKAGSTPVPGESRIVFKVKAAQVPPVDPKDTEFQKLLDQVKLGLEDDIQAQYFAKAQREIGVKINPTALQAAIGGDAGS